MEAVEAAEAEVEEAAAEVEAAAAVAAHRVVGGTGDCRACC